MSKLFSAKLSGASGREYSFDVFSAGIDFNEVGAVYAFLAVPWPQFTDFKVLYVGKANALQRRMGEHRQPGEKWDEAKALGVNAVGAKLVTSESERRDIETDLIRAYFPPLNKHQNALAQIAESLGAYPKTPAGNMLTNGLLGPLGIAPNTGTNYLGGFRFWK
ncbi:MAG: hypothetical protein GC186_09345 [Rhodobacteraceae bacterium]|nr:hypothetical protein [Paracoccaceae bacterium]